MSLAHFQLMAGYNQRMNQQLYSACSQLSAAQLAQNRGAFFGSILATLNHLMVGDLFWLGRFRAFPEVTPPTTDKPSALNRLSDFIQPKQLNDIIYADFAELKARRQQLDIIIIDWLADDVSAEQLNQSFYYQNSRGLSAQRNFAEVLHHVFNHQTHHRGQLSTLLSQAGLDIGETDFIVDIPHD